MAHPRGASTASTARLAAADAVRAIRQHFPPHKPITPETAGLEPRDAALAVAIYRHTLQRWQTLEHLLQQFLHRPLRQLEDHAAAAMLTGAAQLLLFDRLPAHAVVDEAVQLMHRWRRRRLAGLVNAVLRRIAGLVGQRCPGQPWTPGQDVLPLEGGVLQLAEPVLPPPRPLDAHLAVATSHPRRLLSAWIEDHGDEVAAALALAGLRHPPTIVAVEPGFDPKALKLAKARLRPHREAGFYLWEGGHDELLTFVRAHPHRRVQDPAAAEAAACPLDSSPAIIVDACAGRGTKARQLATRYPGADVFATDTDPQRYAELEAIAIGHDNLHPVPPDSLGAHVGRDGADLLLLDVPCSNTAVLARRPEARYRFNQRTVASLVNLQRRIISDALPLLRPGGHLIYSTCSLQPPENQQQMAWMVKQFPLDSLAERRLLPAGSDDAYHDGAYYALIQRRQEAG